MILRVDDYPTGVRPILPDHVEKFGPILDEFEKRGMPYVLGIVPTLCDRKDWVYLKSLKSMLPACHGYDHMYPVYSKLLKDDPYNKKGLAGGASEFHGLSQMVTEKLVSSGLYLMRASLEREVTRFIPPFNSMNPFLEEALIKHGVDTLLCEGAHTSKIPCVSSYPYYIRSSDYQKCPGIANAACVTLHLTWEWDLLREGTSKLSEFLDFIQPARSLATDAVDPK